MLVINAKLVALSVEYAKKLPCIGAQLTIGPKIVRNSVLSGYIRVVLVYMSVSTGSTALFY